MLPVPVMPTCWPSICTLPPLPTLLDASSAPAFSTVPPSSTISPPTLVSPVARITPLLFTTRSIALLAWPALMVTCAAPMLPLLVMLAWSAASSTLARIRPSPVRSMATVLPAASVTVVATICPALATLLATSTALPVALIRPSFLIAPLPGFLNR